MKRLAASLALVVLAACVENTVRLPNQPGGPNADLSALAVRQAWVDSHPDTDAQIRDAIVEGVFVDGMTYGIVELISNPDRRGTGGNAFWRRFRTGDEVRLQWYIMEQRLVFLDGRNRPVCELVLVDETVTRVRYCEQLPGGEATPDSAAADAESLESPDG